MKKPILEPELGSCSKLPEAVALPCPCELVIAPPRLAYPYDPTPCPDPEPCPLLLEMSTDERDLDLARPNVSASYSLLTIGEVGALSLPLSPALDAHALGGGRYGNPKVLHVTEELRFPGLGPALAFESPAPGNAFGESGGTYTCVGSRLDVRCGAGASGGVPGLLLTGELALGPASDEDASAYETGAIVKDARFA